MTSDPDPQENQLDVPEIRIDPEFKDLLVPLTEEEREGLDANLVKNGCTDPLVVWERDTENVLLDGHNRFEICTRKAIPFRVLRISLESRFEAKSWIIIRQFDRRNLTPYTRAELALKLEENYQEEARASQREHGGTAPGRPRTLPTNSSEVIGPEKTTRSERETRTKVAKQAKVGTTTISRVKVLAKEADEDTKKKLRLGEISINQAYKEVQKRSTPNHPPKPLSPLPDGEFDVIYADPPWRYDFSKDRSDKIEAHYSTLSVEELCALKIPAAENAVLFLWATMPKLKEAMSVMEAWGFEYKTGAVWDKEHIGMGHWFRGEHELLLVGTKGKVSPPPPQVRVSSIFREKREGHSKKPEQFYDLIEKYMPGRKYLEAFARPEKRRKGWIYWGDQAEASGTEENQENGHA